MLDWNYIKQRYPKAFERLQGNKAGSYWDIAVTSKGNCYLAIFYDGVKDFGDGSYREFDNRILYDFFDKHLIFISITIDNAFGNAVYNGFDCCYWENIGSFVERHEAEEEAYLKAFEILEQKLTKI